jgi:hypothetical protein
MPWHQVRLSIDDSAVGKHICLYNMFEILFFGMHEPRDAAMFGRCAHVSPLCRQVSYAHET